METAFPSPGLWIRVFWIQCLHKVGSSESGFFGQIRIWTFRKGGSRSGLSEGRIQIQFLLKVWFWSWSHSNLSQYLFTEIIMINLDTFSIVYFNWYSEKEKKPISSRTRWYHTASWRRIRILVISTRIRSLVISSRILNPALLSLLNRALLQLLVLKPSCTSICSNKIED